MNVQRNHVMSVLCAGLLLVSSAGHATTGNPPDGKSARPIPNHVKPDPSSPRFQAAIAQAKAEAAGRITPETKSESGWKAKYNLYVGCTGTPPVKTFSTIQGAVAVAKPYTSIHVCPGTYSNGGAGTGIDVKTSFVEIVGVSPHAGAETLTCGTSEVPLDDSYGINFLNSYGHVKNLTVNNCTTGVEFYANTLLQQNEVSNSWFNSDSVGVYSYDCQGCEVENSHFQNNQYGIDFESNTDATISGNRVESKGNYNEGAGIYIDSSVGPKIEANSISGLANGLVVATNTTLATIAYNHIDGNLHFGIWMSDNTTANTVEGNWINNNSTGVYSEETSGVLASPSSGPNKFLHNSAFGNTLDYYDLTAPYTGGAPGTNAGTADYYKHNKGNTATPSAILGQ